MKQITMLRYACLFLLVATLGCSKSNSGNTGLVGKWKRIQVYISPGGGGSWQNSDDNPVVKIEFKADGHVVSNQEPFSTFAMYKTIGKDSIEFTNAGGQKTYNHYGLENGKLDIWFSCIEGCADRFIRTN